MESLALSSGAWVLWHMLGPLDFNWALVQGPLDFSWVLAPGAPLSAEPRPSSLGPLELPPPQLQLQPPPQPQLHQLL